MPTPTSAAPIPLKYRYFGGENNPPLIILHGLLGSSRNWTVAARGLAEHYEVFTLDMRNHGHSPHSDQMDFSVLYADLLAWVDEQGWKKFHLLGHSLGGKVAMRFACQRPDRLESLIIVDIVPKKYPSHYRSILEKMTSLPLHEYSSRKAIDQVMESIVDDWAFRQFLLTNLERDEQGQWYWVANIKVILDTLEHLSSSPLREEDQTLVPTLFIRGESSDYIRASDAGLIKQHFPRSRLMTIPAAGHNPHIEQREAFIKAIATWQQSDWGCDV